MIILAYDIGDNRLRTRFSKFLSEYGRRIQYSVYEINNSDRILGIVVSKLKNEFENKFSQGDSVIIFKLSSSCETLRFGYAKNEESDLVIV